MDKPVLTNIQRFSIHDGPGIRTTVFFKGCSLHCPWCSNPENISREPQKYVKDGIEGIYGKLYSCDELYEEIIKDRAFYNGDWGTNDLNKMPGGVTFSGGECMLQMERLEKLLQRLSMEKIHLVVESCLYTSTKCLNIAIKYINLFYVDIKMVDKEKCSTILWGDFEVYDRNLRKGVERG